MPIKSDFTVNENQWTSLPNGELFWAPNFMPRYEAEQHFDSLRQQIKWRHDQITLFGKTLPIPRLQAWYGDAPYCYSNLTMQPEPWFDELLNLKIQCEQVANAPLNSVLANLYRDGSDSNGWHSDDEPELGTQPIIASMSFGETRTFHLKHKQSGQKISLELTPGSLLVMAGDMQKHWQHTVPKTKKPKGERINLTFRYVFEK
ncbi:alpha-ketoglutarate-dependent dioxygenase AlkB family protein [Vibrio mexicanus]|uniref:alpha-ketoglutarate-dependent dioxygenase AlkB family protein n=1 Tax=Vibrio mexicanus TaxID=1004326 RepID=UPI00063CA209|nr:alpha-ketoglutarate-dependent dioxygenase AlkB [Vibrio mexicanus]